MMVYESAVANEEAEFDSVSMTGLSSDAGFGETKSIVTKDVPKEEGDYSKTNVQVEGVDEADIVKTDGNYIYYLTHEKLTKLKENEIG